MLKPMYPGRPYSPVTTLTAAIGATAAVITVSDAAALPDAPNIATIHETDERGNLARAETIRYGMKSGNALWEVQRGIEDGDTPAAWKAGAKIARFYTADEHRAIIENISALAEGASGLTTDDAPTPASENPVSSGGVYEWFGAPPQMLQTEYKAVVWAMNELLAKIEALEKGGGGGSSIALPVSVANGGTGAVDAVTARANLGAAGTAVATTSVSGLLSAADKKRIDGLAASIAVSSTMDGSTASFLSFLTSRGAFDVPYWAMHYPTASSVDNHITDAGSAVRSIGLRGSSIEVYGTSSTDCLIKVTTSHYAADPASQPTEYQYTSGSVSGYRAGWRRLAHVSEALTWTAPTLLNGWENLSDTWAVHYTKTSNNIVFVQGAFARSTVPTTDTIFNLPAGFRPAYVIRSASVFIGGGTHYPVVLSLEKGGDIRLQSTSGIGSVGSISVAPIDVCFPAV